MEQIITCPKKEPEQLEKRYQELCRDYLETRGDTCVIEIKAEEGDDARPEPQATDRFLVVEGQTSQRKLPVSRIGPLPTLRRSALALSKWGLGRRVEA